MEQKGPTLSQWFYFFIDQSKIANDRERYFGLDYQKHSMESEGDNSGNGTSALIYWNHFSEAGPFLFHMKEPSNSII